jgi:hypothetical protein
MPGGEVTSFVENWCSYSKKLMSDLEANKDLLASKNVKVNLIDCGTAEGKPLCEAAQVTGYPHNVNSCGQKMPGYVPIDKFVDFATSCPQ